MARRDDSDFLEFAGACRDQMWRTAFLLCGDRERAADITQEALIRLYVAWPRLDHDGGLRRYVRKAVTSAAVDLARKRSSHERPTDQPGERSDADATEAVPERLLLMKALAQLPPRQRACVVLRYYEDLGVEEVAGVLGCRPGTVKSQTARGLVALRAAYVAAGGDLDIDSDPAKEAAAW